MKKLISALVALSLVLSFGLNALAADEQVTIGIAQFAEHGSLDNCREGFIAGLAENGFVQGENLNLLFQNAQADIDVYKRQLLLWALVRRRATKKAALLALLLFTTLPPVMLCGPVFYSDTTSMPFLIGTLFLSDRARSAKSPGRCV